jgi:hypothetical protein
LCNWNYLRHKEVKLHILHNTIYSILTTIITFTLQLTLCPENIISKTVPLNYLVWADTCPFVCALLWACYTGHTWSPCLSICEHRKLYPVLDMLEPIFERQQCWVMVPEPVRQIPYNGVHTSIHHCKQSLNWFTYCNHKIRWAVTYRIMK